MSTIWPLRRRVSSSLYRCAIIAFFIENFTSILGWILWSRRKRAVSKMGEHCEAIRFDSTFTMEVVYGGIAQVCAGQVDFLRQKRPQIELNLVFVRSEENNSPAVVHQSQIALQILGFYFYQNINPAYAFLYLFVQIGIIVVKNLETSAFLGDCDPFLWSGSSVNPDV